MTVLEAIRAAERRLRAIPEPRLDAEYLLAEALHTSRLMMLVEKGRALTDAVPVKLKMGEYNTLRYEADGEVLKVYINGELVQQAHLPTRQKTAASATTSESEVIVKIVNFSPDPEDVEITLDCPVEDGYTLAYLAGDGDAMNDENNPENVHDVVTACTGASEAFTFHAPANSANVLILKKK